MNVAVCHWFPPLLSASARAFARDPAAGDRCVHVGARPVWVPPAFTALSLRGFGLFAEVAQVPVLVGTGFLRLVIVAHTPDYVSPMVLTLS